MNSLNSLNGWAENRAFYAPHSAQGYLNGNVGFAASSCGSSCGSSEPKPSACGAGDPEPKPSACGAGDDPKPSSCGSSCGAGEK